MATINFQGTDLRDLGAQGSVRVILTRNIGRRAFKHCDDDDAIFLDFLSVRGTESFVAALRKLDVSSKSGTFALRANPREINVGYDLGVLNEVMLTNEFMPLYQWREAHKPKFENFRELLKNSLTPVGLEEFSGPLINELQQSWKEWVHNDQPKRIMLSRYGLFQVMLDRKIKEGETLFEIVEPVQRLGRRLVDTVPGLKEEVAAKLNDDAVRDDLKKALRVLQFYSVQWEIAREMIVCFLKEAKNKYETIRVEGDTDKSLRIITAMSEMNDTTDTPQSVYNSRFRYIIYNIHCFKDVNRDVKIPRTEATNNLVSQAIGCLLENAPVEQGGRKYLEGLKAPALEALMQNDVATWSYEHCIFTRDNAIFYYTPGTKFRDYDYDRYWGSIMRATRYILEVRLVAKILEVYTSVVLEEMAATLGRALDKPRANSEELRAKLPGIARQISDWARILARLRLVSSPTTIGSSDYAIVKYERLREELGIKEIIDNASANINLIINLLAEYEKLVA